MHLEARSHHGPKLKPFLFRRTRSIHERIASVQLKSAVQQSSEPTIGTILIQIGALIGLDENSQTINQERSGSLGLRSALGIVATLLGLELSPARPLVDTSAYAILEKWGVLPVL